MRKKTIIFTSLFLLLFSSTYAKELDHHRFGFSIEGGVSSSFAGSYDNGQPWHDILGTAGGTLFYQYRISKRFALKPEFGLYSYFFDIPGPRSLKSGPYATLNGRLGLSLILYTYVGADISLPLGLTPFISSRFYDSAGKKKTSFSDTEIEVLKENYFSGGVQLSFGIESTRSKPVGGGFSVFFRIGDKFDTGGQITAIIPSFGGILLMFF